MKQITILIILILFSYTNTIIVNVKKSIPTLTIIPRYDNKMFNFAEGVLSELIGKQVLIDINQYKKCIPNTWIKKNVDKGEELFAKNYNVWEKAKNYFDSILDKVCAWRQNISIWLVRSTKIRVKSLKNILETSNKTKQLKIAKVIIKPKMEVQDKNLKKNSQKSELINNQFSSFIEIQTKTERKMNMKNTSLLIPNCITCKNSLNWAIDWIIDAKPVLLELFQSPLIKNLRSFLNCLTLLYKNTSSNLKDNLVLMENLLIDIVNWEGSVKVFVKLLCNWRILNFGIRFLLEAINKKNNKEITWNLYGRYIGRLFNIIGNPNLSDEVSDDSHSLNNLEVTSKSKIK